MNDLVQQKTENPRDMSLEKALKLWKGEEPTRFTEEKIARLLGIFRRNFARLNMTIHVSNTLNKTKPIAEPLLRAIWNDLAPDRRDILDLMVYGAERREALYLLPLENVHLVENSHTAILDIPARLSKTGIGHPSIIPKELAERLLDRATTLGHTVLVPSYRSLWREITHFAKEKHQVRLTSHYFRKRFETIAERIPANEMNPNHWVILMGSKPKLGHLPDIYSLLSNKELITEYESQLMPRLNLSGETPTAHPDQLTQLLAENQELKEQIIKLTKLLTEALAKS
jgi:hypothetical protein